MREPKKHENYPPAHYFEYLYDLCLVRPSQVPNFRSLESDSGELGNRLLRVLLSGSGEPHRVLRIQHRTTEDHARGHHALGLLGFLGPLSRRENEVELRGGIRLHRPGSVFCFPQVVGALEAD